MVRCFCSSLFGLQATDTISSPTCFFSHQSPTQEDLDAVLHAAARNGRIAIVRRMLERGAAVNTLHPLAGSALHAAAGGRNCVAGIDFLLGRGANIHAQWGEHGTPLHVASITGNLAAIKALVQHGADIDFEGREYGTALQAACALGEHDAAILLIEHGANVHQRGGKYGSAWHAAVAYDWYSQDELEKVLTALLDRGVDVNDTQGRQHATALQAALELKPDWCFGFIKFLIRHGADPNIMAGNYGFLLQLACAKSEFETIEFLLTECPAINVNAEGGIFGFALQAAASSDTVYYRSERETVKLVRVLLERGADPNLRGGRYGSALNAAVLRGFWDTVDVLLAAGAKPDCKLLSEPDEEWLEQVRERDGSHAVARYKKFWDVEMKTGT
ncbi:ankyrin repeat-containing domain protein [Chaetomium tenue]|uniref:Ankyrin repeat-containing domain protein n=1 Tax=Chaetomium tenue TaxID=1854479 RepID=A0ACB7PE49_9PEZI|nr:ankyrin repeat-containing domain protein [Chaetomium globosum]